MSGWTYCRCCASRWWRPCPSATAGAWARATRRSRRLADSAFILFPRHMAPGLYDDVVSFCRSAGFSPRVEQEAVQMQTIVSLVSAGLGVALIPASLRHLGRTGVVYRQLREVSPLTEIALAWRARDARPTLAAFSGCRASGSRAADTLRRVR